MSLKSLALTPLDYVFSLLFQLFKVYKHFHDTPFVPVELFEIQYNIKTPMFTTVLPPKNFKTTIVSPDYFTPTLQISAKGTNTYTHHCRSPSSPT